MKKPESLLKEYAQRLSEENLKFVNGRLTQRLSGDLPEVLNFFSNNNDMDRWLSSAKNSWELFDMLDALHKFVDKEYSTRFGEAA
jgi:hypothetical protein